MKILKLKIEGMTCDHCAQSVDKRFEGKKGVLFREISYPSASGKFEYDPRLITKEEIIETINATGHYRVAGETVDNINEKDLHYDLIIVGGGSAAFSAAIKAGSLGIKTLMINGGLDFGGTCVNVGCVPSKNLIRAAEAAFHASHSRFPGIRPRGSDINFKEVIRGKKKLVAALQQQKYMDVVKDIKNLTLLKGFARFTGPKTVSVDGTKKFTAHKFLIATGSSTNIPPINGLEQVGYLTNATLFDLEEKPESMTILGAGYIGLETAMAYNRLGVKVRILEFTDRVLRSQTPDISRVLEQQLRDEGIEILPGMRIKKFERNGDDIVMNCVNAKGESFVLHEKGKIVIATGIKANTQNIGVQEAGLKLSHDGHIAVNDKMETNVPHIYAAGDVADTPSYVYTAAYEGKIAVENAFAGAGKRIDYSSLPWVVFTDPQVAGTGMDETEAEKAGIPYQVSKLELKDVPRALAANDTRGFIKLIRNPETGRLLGARVVASEGGEIIQMLSMAVKYGISVSDLAENLYPYLTLSEGIKLAALAFDKDVSKLSCCAG